LIEKFLEKTPFTKFAQSMVLMPKRITLYFPSLTGGGSQNLNDGNSIICFSFFFLRLP